MAIIKSIPSRKIINGLSIDSSEISVVSELEYITNGESCIIVRGVSESVITLNSITTDHVVIKSMTKVTIKPNVGKIDEEYDEIIAAMREDDNDELADNLKFKKALVPY